MPVSGLAPAEHLPVGDVLRRGQRRGAVANVVVDDPFRVARTQGKHRLRALQGLTLTLLINA